MSERSPVLEVRWGSSPAILTFDPLVDVWEGPAVWRGSPAILCVAAEDNIELVHERVASAAFLCLDEDVADLVVRRYEAGELLQIKNDHWLDEDEPPVTADEFVSRLSLESIAIDGDAAYSFWFADGDL